MVNAHTRSHAAGDEVWKSLQTHIAMHGGWWQGESLSVFKIIHCIHDAFCIGFVPVRAVLLRPIDYNHVAAKHHALVLCAIRNWVELLCLHNSKTI